MSNPESPFFDLEELVCPDVFKKYGKFGWNFVDYKLLTTINTIRDRFGKPMIVNTWKDGGELSQRGLRCNLCSLVKSKTELYMSAHCLGKAVDFEVPGLVAEEVRQWILKNKNWWPYHIRLEKKTDWIHLDVYDNPEGLKVYFFDK